MKIFTLFSLTAILLFASSCRVQKTVNNGYLQNVADTTIKDINSFPEPIIQKNDLLSIKIFSSSVIPLADAPYNLPEQGGGAGGTGAVSGFLVDPNGNIEYPHIGTLHVEGLTKTQLAKEIKTRLEGQLTQPVVIIRFLNFRVTVLGEVKTPGSYTIPTERITILEALGLAGDISEYGKRNTVKVLRENNGERKIGTLDLTSKEMFNSPYYKLEQNDVVFVEPTKIKIKQVNQQQRTQQIQFALSIITSIALLYNIFK